MSFSMDDCICDLEDQYYTRVIEDEHMLLRVFQLRYKIYCQERGFLTGEFGLERDEFDERSGHIGLFRRQTEELIGTARLVMPSLQSPHTSFPMQSVCEDGLLDRLPLSSSAEISRFAMSKEDRRSASTPLVRMALVRGLVRLSHELGVTHWCAIMEPTLIRLLRMTSIYFHPLGRLVEYHGPRQPCFNRLDLLLAAVQRERPALWGYLTGHSGLPIDPPHSDIGTYSPRAVRTVAVGRTPQPCHS